ncbi:ParB/RepB/Spo0J family partition protein [Porphyrobacter sp. CACIAM 03H1]|uniref:ParB/RepB/Spo0J family partition protein n=1 Tax=Porphyrobacter sp. CACIAM 03H1 TaxID=2003315 RepID=UPI000B5A8701|nr:ParB/RepB/Spo0J family partition protein [Porphyrobacter sp. CACIAM 03H1]ASJ89826.1 chromosome partitioning protein ParB [Porphyrobacter sp. CACIAM 03H1]
MTEDTAQTAEIAANLRASADKPRRLGKGLGALLGETRREEPLVRREDAPAEAPAAGSSPLRMLAIASIKPLPGNPRKHFDEAALDELAASIATRGVIQPIIVRPHPGGEGFQLVAGERRWRAAQKARLHEIPALVRNLSEREVIALALIENLQREDLNPVEEARAYHRLSEDEGMIQVDIAKMVEKSRSHVANMMRLVTLPDPVLDLIQEGKLSIGHARALIGRDDALHLAELAVAEGLSVRDIETLTKKPRARLEPAQPGYQSSENADILAVQQHLEEFLGLSVRIKPEVDPRKGTITIRYTTLDQLDLVCQRLTGGEI